MMTGFVRYADWNGGRMVTGPLPIENAIVLLGSVEPTTPLMASRSEPAPLSLVFVTVKVAAFANEAAKRSAKTMRSLFIVLSAVRRARAARSRRDRKARRSGIHW